MVVLNSWIILCLRNRATLWGAHRLTPKTLRFRPTYWY